MVRALSPQSLPMLSPPPIYNNFGVTHNPCSSTGAISVTDTLGNHSVHAQGATACKSFFGYFRGDVSDEFSGDGSLHDNRRLDIVPDDATAPTAPTASPMQTPAGYGDYLGQSRVLFNFDNLIIRLLVYFQMITRPPTTSKACRTSPVPRLRVSLPEGCITKECRAMPGDNSCICKGTNRRDSKQSKGFTCLNWYASRTSLSVYYLSCEQQEDIHDPQKCQPTQVSFQESAPVFQMDQRKEHEKKCDGTLKQRKG
ncbi:hypothetical protein BU17DRAFT_89888 [Hysterangium stoloniferum]|nr:hypothetical protein BU17DRAFT_89888 [Hysterangium stoloniferum]